MGPKCGAGSWAKKGNGWFRWAVLQRAWCVWESDRWSDWANQHMLDVMASYNFEKKWCHAITPCDNNSNVALGGEIRSAYLKLAKKLHPDVSKDADDIARWYMRACMLHSMQTCSKDDIGCTHTHITRSLHTQIERDQIINWIWAPLRHYIHTHMPMSMHMHIISQI
jgi:hypothetical protein